jgi:hypothetical protein
MQKIAIVDSSISHQKGMCKCIDPSLVEWDRSIGDKKVVVFTDMCLRLAELPQYRDSFKIALLIEPHVIAPLAYDYIVNNFDKFDLILTHHKKLTSITNKAHYYPFGTSWINKAEWAIYDKTKNISIIASTKNYVKGHQLRHQVIKKCKAALDVYGYGYKPVDEKVDALKDYKFSVTIENCQENDYFTEKLIDCFLTGTVPIYWGFNNIGKYFNPDGIITISDDISTIEKTIFATERNADDFYYSSHVQKAIKENFEVAKQYVCPDDLIYTEILKPNGIV